MRGTGISKKTKRSERTLSSSAFRRRSGKTRKGGGNSGGGGLKTYCPPRNSLGKGRGKSKNDRLQSIHAILMLYKFNAINK